MSWLSWSLPHSDRSSAQQPCLQICWLTLSAVEHVGRGYPPKLLDVLLCPQKPAKPVGGSFQHVRSIISICPDIFLFVSFRFSLSLSLALSLFRYVYNPIYFLPFFLVCPSFFLSISLFLSLLLSFDPFLYLFIYAFISFFSIPLCLFSTLFLRILLSLSLSLSVSL